MLHPATELRYVGPEIGYGVFVTAPLPRGTVVWVLDALDRRLSAEEVAALPAALRRQVETYAYVDSQGAYVLCWDFGRYMNHSCRPATRSLGEAYEIVVRDLSPGDELTCEYGTLNLSRGFACACGSAGCRGRITPDDIMALGDAWDAEIAAALRCAAGLEQPILAYAQPTERDRGLREALEGRLVLTPPSVRAARSRSRPAPRGPGGGLWSLPGEAAR